MTIAVKLFARAAELAGTRELQVPLDDGATVAQLRRQLSEVAPQLASLVPHLLMAINSQYAAETQIIPPEAEVACFPPVSGG